MRINTTTDYAMRIILYLAQQSRVVPSSEMANMMSISQRYLLSIAKKLNKHGYIDVDFGANGGFSISKAPDKISMYDIIVLMEGTLPVSRCLTKENHCEETPCILHAGYSFLQNIIECYLRGLTVDLLVGQPIHTWQKHIIDKLCGIFNKQQQSGKTLSTG